MSKFSFAKISKCYFFYFVFSPKLGMIIVKKRGSARFFARDPRGSRQLINPPPGTIIDHTVTNQEWYDFYLVSQMARQGTVAPTHFNVIWDRTGLVITLKLFF